MTQDGAAPMSYRVRPWFLLSGVAVFVGVLCIVWVSLGSDTRRPDLGPLFDEPIWSEVPPGGAVVFEAKPPHRCESGGASVYMRLTVPSGYAAVSYYEEIADQTGWAVSDDDRYPGATKQADDRKLSLSFEGWETDDGGVIEVRGYSEPDGC